MDEGANVIPLFPEPPLPNEVWIRLPLDGGVDRLQRLLEHLHLTNELSHAMLNKAPQHGDGLVLRKVLELFEGFNYLVEA